MAPHSLWPVVLARANGLFRKDEDKFNHEDDDDDDDGECELLSKVSEFRLQYTMVRTGMSPGVVSACFDTTKEAIGTL
jgi:hypothetical protein